MLCGSVTMGKSYVFYKLATFLSLPFEAKAGIVERRFQSPVYRGNSTFSDAGVIRAFESWISDYSL